MFSLGRSEIFSSFENELFSKAKSMEKITDLKELDKPINFFLKNLGENSDSRYFSRCPIEGHNGHWESEKGDSVWKPNKEDIPPCSNPEGKTWGEILKEHKTDGIEYKDGKPDFSPVAKAEVQIDDFTGNRAKNFEQADEKLAKEKKCSPEEIKQWRKENNYTWHECSDCKTMQLVPSEIHNNMPHAGGIYEYKNKNEVK